MTATCVMVLGTTSGAGKSWLTTALCRYYARQGLKVAPFKAQNMSNNARVVGPHAPTLRGSQAPTLPTACGALPPEGAAFSLGAAWRESLAPMLPTAYGSLPPEGAAFSFGAAQRESLVATDASGGEIGSAQYFQALAARAVPEVRMNPLLLKPERDTHSQVVLMGQVNKALTQMDWRGRSKLVWPVIAQALDELIAENDVVVIEGAGSPAEINLHDSDIVNMRVALHCSAACLLVTDIDRGGAFAHLYGTWALLPEGERALIKGFVLNKFRGDTGLLAPAPQMLHDMTGVPTVATLPMWWQHGLPEEDGVFDATPTLPTACGSLPPEGARLPRGGPSENAAPTLPTACGSLPPEGARLPRGGPSENRPLTFSGFVTIAVIAYPRISNLDEFQPLKNVPGVRLQWVRSPAELAGLNAATDWIILPGSKHTSGDLAWLRQQGLDAAIAHHAGQGGAVLGICGGLQMLGEALIDPHGIDGNAPGLGLLPLVTVFAPDKTVKHTQTQFAPVMYAQGNAAVLASGSPWLQLAGVTVQGYEIHHGQTAQHPAMAQAGDLAVAVLPDDLAWLNQRGNVLGIYVHGLFEDVNVMRALFGATVPTLDSVFDGLADYIDKHFEPGVLQALVA